MLYYPPINSAGTLVQLPYKRGFNFSNVVQGNPTGRPYSFAMIGGGLTNFPNNPLGSFAITYSTLTDAERAVVKNFVENVAVGSLNTFAYIDTNGNLVTASENVSDASWTLSGVTINATAPDPYGGDLASAVTATVSSATLRTTVIPTGSVSGFTFNLSVWVKPPTLAQTMTLSFLDASNTVLTSAQFNVPGGAWKRISLPYVCTTTGALQVQITINSYGSATLSLFAAQCVATAGAGPYLRSPGSVGLHPKCRLDIDSFPWKFVQAGSTGVVIPIQEIM